MEKIREIVRIKQEVKRGVSKFDTTKINSPQDAVKLVTQVIGDEDREVLLVLVLNTKNQVNAIHRCHIGSINASIVHPREVMKAAILNNGASIIIAHNHPSYDTLESEQDKEVSRRIKEAGKILGIELLDSLIVSNDEGNYTSLKEKGYI
ncbi:MULTISPECIES: JAB domain-containing protein [Bacillota]|uniref:JAB domain-containing protein n=1 Tax=Bacillota TaxID=1239 RepID=UPI0039EF2DBD